MEKLVKYRKQMILIAIIAVIMSAGFGGCLLHIAYKNINYSKNDAHIIALKKFPGTIISSKIEYEDLQTYYELIIKNKNDEHIVVEISAKTGSIVGYEYGGDEI